MTMTTPTDKRAAEIVDILGTIHYRDDHGFRWAPMPGENPRAGGKVRVRVSDFPHKHLSTGTYLNGTITVDPITITAAEHDAMDLSF